MKEFSQLNYFRMVAHLQNMTKAAEHLNISQPSLSRAIKRLEDDLGVRLFDRVKGRLILNKFGTEYLEYVDKAFELLEAGENKLKSHATSTRVPFLSVACSVQIFAEELIRQFFIEQPEIRLNISYSRLDTASISNGLWNNTIDLAFTPEFDFPPEVHWESLFSCEVCGLVGNTNPISRIKKAPLSSFRDKSFICNNVGIDRRLTIQYCSKAGFVPNIIFESNESTLAGSWVERDTNVALIPAIDYIMLSKTVDELPVSLVLLEDPCPLFRLGIAVRHRDLHEEQPGPEFKKFIAFAKKSIMELDRSFSDEWRRFCNLSEK